MFAIFVVVHVDDLNLNATSIKELVEFFGCAGTYRHE